MLMSSLRDGRRSHFSENHVPQSQTHGAVFGLNEMSKAPIIGKYLDSDEEELHRAIESNSYTFCESTLTPERKSQLQKAARNTLNGDRVQITLRATKHNLLKLKARALREGMPYHTNGQKY